MAWTNVGYDGTITEIQWAGLAGLLGNGYVAAGDNDCITTAVAAARQVSVAAGSLYGDGVLSTNSAAETLSLTTPVNGQWYLVALQRDWAANTSVLVAIASATTTTATPTTTPTSFPVLNTNAGVLTDQPIAWAWCNSANTSVAVYDIRLRAVKSLPPKVANAYERDAKFISPDQGLQVWRNDLGVTETYYELYNSSTNPGGLNPSGWYPSGAGNVLQTIFGTSTNQVSNSSTNFVDTTLSATITPQRKSSRILILISQQAYVGGANANNGWGGRILRGSTAIHTFASEAFRSGTTLEMTGVIPATYLDSPNSVSPVTYKTQFKNTVASNQVTSQQYNASSMILMEVSA
tara:strand:- start:3066 stop:4112 length:1047 start_codon:yes stop_codon:yes gene_type:complete